MDVLIAGCGWLGREVARRLLARGDRVTGLTRTEISASALRAFGLPSVAVDLADPDASGRVPGRYDGIVAMQAASGRDLADYTRAYIHATGGLLDSGAVDGAAFVYVSSTGVFGQADGSWVDETTPPDPADETAVVLVEAERLVLDRSRHRARPCIVRCSGLYGPGRTGTIDRVRTGALALGAGDAVWMNFCHRDDAASTIVAALDRAKPGAIYHASDAAPASRREVVDWIAARLVVAQASSSEKSAPRRSRAANRRVSAEATRSELGISLAYPSFREGLGPFLG
jgi:nucleoside-diphosphate-sugar epimerase